MKISVIIPTWNRADTLRLVLESLARQRYEESYEVLVCDSNSTDGTNEMVQSLSVPYKLRYLCQDNKGRSGARNLGIQNATGEYILFTDADIIAHEDLLVEHIESHRRVQQTQIYSAVVGCEIRVKDLAELQFLQTHSEKQHEIHAPHRKFLPWYFFLTGNASVSRNVLDKSGHFDESFQGYGMEDLELGYRINKAGISIVYNRKALNYHLHPVTFEDRLKLKRQSGNSIVYFYHKHRDWRIKYALGLNPVSMALFSLFSRHGAWVSSCEREAKKNDGVWSSMCREIIIQYYYLTGVKEALKKNGWKERN